MSFTKTVGLDKEKKTAEILVAALMKHSLFHKVDEAYIMKNLILFIFKIIVSENTVIYSQGQILEYFYFVLNRKSTHKIFKNEEKNFEILIINPDVCFGDSEIVYGIKRYLIVCFNEECILCYLNKDKLNQVMDYIRKKYL